MFARFALTMSPFTCEGEDVVRGLTLVQPNAANLHARLEGMSAMRPSQVVNQAKCRAHFDVGSIVVQADERVAGVDRKRQRAGLWIVIRRAIDIKLGFIEELRRESVLQRHDVIRGMVDDLQFVFWKAAAIRRVHQADVALRASVEQSLLA